VFILERRTPSDRAAQALQQLLVSNASKISSLGLCCCSYIIPNKQIPGLRNIVRGAISSKSVQEVEIIDPPGGSDETFKMLNSIIQCKPNLTSLIISMSHWTAIVFGPHQQLLLEAMVELLGRRRKSPLRRFEILSHAIFQELRAAISRSTQLESLAIKNMYTSSTMDQLANMCRRPAPADVRALLESVRSFKVTGLALDFVGPWPDADKELVLGALQRNYRFQSIQCTYHGRTLFNEAGQARLQVYVDRNRKLAQCWIKNPKLVPRELWPEAMELALKAGLDSLYQSLLVLSGHGIGHSSRKRKRSSLSELRGQA